MAHARGARTIWVINVGDIKPMELPFTFAMSMAWNIENITPSTISNFFEQYSLREFGPDHASEISALLMGHDRLLALRRHEQVEADTFSVLNYREGESIVSAYEDLEKRASSLLELVPNSAKASFFQLVLHPIKASRIYVELRVEQAKNRLYGIQDVAVPMRLLDVFLISLTMTSPYLKNTMIHPGQGRSGTTSYGSRITVIYGTPSMILLEI